MMVLLCFFSGCSLKTGVKTGQLVVTVMDLKKADAILIQTENYTVLIDTAEEASGQELVGYLKKNAIDTIDCLIITHFDKDHVGGADHVISQMNVRQIAVPDYEKDSRQYLEYIQATANAGLEPIRVTKEINFEMDDAQVVIYPTLTVSYDGENDNDMSLVVSVKHGDNSMLFAADSEAERLKELLAQGNLEHDFLKVPHHGRYSDNIQAFIEAVHPAYAVTTSGDDMEPDERVLQALDMVGCINLDTNGDGPVGILSDGQDLILK